MQATQYLLRVKLFYIWHVASLGIILSKADDNKGADKCTFFYVPPPKGRGKYCFFGADPVGIGVSVGVSMTLSCLHDIS